MLQINKVSYAASRGELDPPCIKAKQIKAAGLWLDVRNQYVNLKEMYLSRWWDIDHPSFVVYIEAVNNVYNQYFV